jgi:threonine synthase
MSDSSSPKIEDAGVSCSGCGQSYPETGFHYRCPHCESLFELVQPLPYDPFNPGQTTGIDRFRRSFSIPQSVDFLSLGEGNTALVPDTFIDREVFFKCEFANPSGSFKDRGTAVLVNLLSGIGILNIVEDSSGNAGASLAAYASQAGIHARIFIPDYASGPKRKQIEAYGAELVLVPGTRSDTSKAVLDEAAKGYAYASHAHLPHGIAGMATIAFELVEQLGGSPGAVLTPLGQGTLLLGLAFGFRSLKAAGIIETLPILVGLQAANCAPIWEKFANVSTSNSQADEGETIAEGIRIIDPLRSDAVVREIKHSGGKVIAVDEESILQGRSELGLKGFYVEPTSAIVWGGLRRSIEHLPDPVVAVLTGSGYKDLDNH